MKNTILFLLLVVYINDGFSQTTDNIFRIDYPDKFTWRYISKEVAIKSLRNEVQVFIKNDSVYSAKLKVVSFNIFLWCSKDTPYLERSYKTNTINPQDTASIANFIRNNLRTKMFIEEITVNDGGSVDHKLPPLSFKIE